MQEQKNTKVFGEKNENKIFAQIALGGFLHFFVGNFLMGVIGIIGMIIALVGLSNLTFLVIGKKPNNLVQILKFIIILVVFIGLYTISGTALLMMFGMVSTE